MTARLTSTPQIPPRPLSAASASSSNAFMRPTIPRPLKGLDSALTPEARHKRKISLSMLKARIDSEREAHAARPVTQALPPLTAMKEEELSSPSTQSPRAPFNLPDSDPTHPRSLSRSQHFRDESHIFWCHACSGDLVVL
ncbi:uncharacterized protein EI90DRAFT_3077121 [Cantharellus anzutake]|uniref:uncharacterized protein n=1 Tax=Cantharellus anzutake TaxID=1750568 RepID=UPI001907FB73|nr:uncharacterized protein EI90DRAFT_3077121 [Cantharellus anzutake]KAF8322999.1 hypothetical protein EI90DRAFT_3077121 [Cantharellus anzutake]